MGEFCSLPPMMLNPRPSSVLGSSTTLGWAWPSLAAKAATVAWSEEQSHDHHTEISWLIFDLFRLSWINPGSVSKSHSQFGSEFSYEHEK